MENTCNSFCISLFFANGEDISEYFEVKKERDTDFSDRIIQEIDVGSFESIRLTIEEKIIVLDGDVILNYDNFKSDWHDYWNSVSVRDYSDLNSVILMTLDDVKHRINYKIIHIKPSIKIITGEEEQSFLVTDKKENRSHLRNIKNWPGYVKVKNNSSGDAKCELGYFVPGLPYYLNSLLDNMPNADENFQYILRKYESPRYEITSYIGTSSSVDVPETLGGIKVEEFSLGERRDILKISIPDSVEYDISQMLECEGLYDDSGNLIISGRLLRIKNITPIIRIPDGVQTVAESVLYWDEEDSFYNHQKDDIIEELILPEGLKRIEEHAFKNCKSLRAIQFPKSLEEIECGAFSGCKALTEIVLPEGTKKIGSHAFESCQSLKVIRVPSTCEIEEQAFENCSAGGNGHTVVNGILFDVDLDDVIIVPPEVQSISAYAIEQPGAILKEVTITDNIKYISDRAFGITGIRCFRVVDHLTGKPLFETKKFKSSYSSDTCLSCSPRFVEVCDLICAGEFSALAEYGKVFTEDDYKKMDKSPKQNAAINMSEIKKIWEYHLNGEGKQTSAIIWGYLGNDTVINIPSQIGEYQVKAIGYEAFSDCTSLVSVTIPQSVVEIGRNAFSNCTSLKEIRIPDGVETIEDNTFLNCSSLESVAIPQSVRKIGHDAFANCTNLREIRIPDGIESIEENAFLNCLNLEGVSISERVTCIGTKAFCGCKKLLNKEGFIIVRDVLFNYYGTNDSVSIPEGVAKIDEGVFSGNSNLLSICLPDSVISIGREAFSNCSNLKNIAIPKGIKNIGSAAFRGCSHLKNVELSGSDICIEREAFCDCSELENISLLNVLSIGPQAFRNCTNLKSISVSMPNLKDSYSEMCCPYNALFLSGNGRCEIGDEAFSGCTNLETAVLAERVCAIGKKAFSNCTNLKSIILSDLILDIALDAFEGCPHLSEISVVPDYSKPNKNWLKEYGELIEKDPIIVFEQKNFVFQPEAGYVNSGRIDFTLVGVADFLFKEKTAGLISNRVSGKTDYLVIEPDIVDKKLQTAIELKNSGKPVKIVLYNDFLSSLFARTILNKSSESTSTKSTTKSSSPSSSSTSELKAPVQNIKADNESTISKAKAKKNQESIDDCETKEEAKTKETTTKSAPSKSKRGSSSSGKNLTETSNSNDIYDITDSTGRLKRYKGNETDIVLPNGIKIIGKSAFKNTKITSVVIPEGVEMIDDYAFSDCKNLKSVLLPNSIKYIGNHAFYSCEQLKSIVIPEGVDTIESEVFCDCYNLEKVVLPSKIKKIGEDAFSSCRQLTRFIVPEDCEEIGLNAFYQCEKLKDLYVPGSVRKVGVFLGLDTNNTVIHTIRGSYFDHFSSMKGYKVDYQYPPSNTTSIASTKTTYTPASSSRTNATSSNATNYSPSKDTASPNKPVVIRGITFTLEELEKLKSYYPDKKYSAIVYVRVLKNVEVEEATKIVEEYIFGEPVKTPSSKSTSSASTSNSTNTNSGGCYIATAVYGSYDCPEVWTLRRYRDYTLAETWYGRAFIKAYYAISPALVKWFGHTEWFKAMWRGILDPMVSNLRKQGVESSPYQDRNW